MNQIVFMDIKSRNANFIYLAALWLAVRAFMDWSYTSWHWLRPRDARLDKTSFLCFVTALTLLAVEFILNYPSDKLWLRTVSAVLALLFLGFSMPTL